MVWIKVGGTGTQATTDLRLPMMWFFALAAAGATMAAVLGAGRGADCCARRAAALTDIDRRRESPPDGS